MRVPIEEVTHARHREAQHTCKERKPAEAAERKRSGAAEPVSDF